MNEETANKDALVDNFEQLQKGNEAIKELMKDS
jgi:hypothetical protein